MSKLAVIVKTRTQPGKRAEVRQLWDEHLRPRAEANDAQELYFFCEDIDDPDAFWLFEIYSDRQEMLRNAGASWFADYMSKVGPLLAKEPPIFGAANPTWSKGYPL